jgi:hypothetical protein
MAKATPEDGSTIEELLQQRAKFEDWLAKLDESQKLATEAVRERVRMDYEKRLTTVVDELRGHADAVADQLAELRNTQSDLTSKQEASEEALAEAELRHAVGEYTEDEWEKLSAESSEALDEVKQQLGQVNEEIDRLAEVQALIAAPVPAPAKGKRAGRKVPVYNSESWVPDAKQAAGQRETLTPPAPLDAAEAEADAGRRKVGAPKFVPRGKGKPGGKPKTLRFPTGGAAAAAGGAEVDELGPTVRAAAMSVPRSNQRKSMRRKRRVRRPSSVPSVAASISPPSGIAKAAGRSWPRCSHGQGEPIHERAPQGAL